MKKIFFSLLSLFVLAALVGCVQKKYDKASKEFVVIEIPEAQSNAAFCSSKDNKDLVDDINKILTDLRTSGEFTKLENKWFNSDNESISEYSNENFKEEITFGTYGDMKPFNYKNEKDELVGFDIELAKIIAKKLGKKLNIKTMPFSELLLQ